MYLGTHPAPGADSVPAPLRATKTTKAQVQPPLLPLAYRVASESQAESIKSWLCSRATSHVGGRGGGRLCWLTTDGLSSRLWIAGHGGLPRYLPKAL